MIVNNKKNNLTQKHKCKSTITDKSNTTNQKNLKMKFYPLEIPIHSSDINKLNKKFKNKFTSFRHKFREIDDNGNEIIYQLKAVNTGVMRSPNKGEIYISGAIPTAYEAPNDLSMEFYIAKLVVTKTKQIETIAHENI